MADNPVRPCWGCMVFDSDPRHEIIDPETGADVAGGPMHVDCCAEKRGCASCAYQRQGLDPSVIGEAFRQHVLSLPPVQIEHVPNDDPNDPHNLTTAVITPLEG